MTVCPQCQANANETDSECPKCGILFSKWQERENNVASGNLSKYDSLANATSSEFNWVILVIVAIAVAGIFYFMSQNAKDILKDI
jgi:uncharacterized membrane protein YvbJ